MDVDVNDDITYFIDSTSYFHDILYPGLPVKAKFVVDDISGSIDFVNDKADWLITGHVPFIASGYFTEGSCRTTQFTVSFNDYWTNGDSAYFTIPALSGSGSQACGSYSNDLNDHFDLGYTGAVLYVNKFTVTPL